MNYVKMPACDRGLGNNSQRRRSKDLSGVDTCELTRLFSGEEKEVGRAEVEYIYCCCFW